MRVVLDTNTLISALLFSGTASQLVALWQSRRITPLVTRAMFEEYLQVLAYPKFRLIEGEINALLEQAVLPFVETIRVRRRLRSVVRDASDLKFLECAIAGQAEYLVTGDLDLRELRSFRGVTILTPGEFLRQIGHR